MKYLVLAFLLSTAAACSRNNATQPQSVGAVSADAQTKKPASATQMAPQQSNVLPSTNKTETYQTTTGAPLTLAQYENYLSASAAACEQSTCFQ